MINTMFTATLEGTPKVDAEYEAAIDNLITEMKRMREQMTGRPKREIERQRAETRTILSQLKVNGQRVHTFPRACSTSAFRAARPDRLRELLCYQPQISAHPAACCGDFIF